MIYSCYKIAWTEYERGWGCRPDGNSFHKTKDDAEAYIKWYWDREKKSNPSGIAPDEYMTPGKPTLVEVTKEFHDRLQQQNIIWTS